MLFPFTIEYQKRLKGEFNLDERIKTMKYIESFILKKKGDILSVTDTELNFKSSLLTGDSLGILGPVENGRFRITQKNDKKILAYEFFMYRLFIIVTVMSVVVGLGSKELINGIICFAWLGGMNWLIALIRHRIMLVNMTNEINSMINTNT